MKTIQTLYRTITAVSAALLMAWPATALDVKVLSINTGTQSGTVKAEIIGQEEEDSVVSVTGRRYEMYSGVATERNVYRLFGQGNRFISAEVDGLPSAGNDYFYQLEVKFKSGKVVKTDCFNAAMTEGAVWLSDINRSDATFSTEYYKIGYDECPNADPGSPIMIKQTPHYYGKGISLKSTVSGGNVRVVFNTKANNVYRNQYNAPFTYVKCTLGFQAYKADGSNALGFARLVLSLNGAETGWRGNLRPFSNPKRGTGTYMWDVTETRAAGITSVGFQVLNSLADDYPANSGWDDNYANLAACRLYYALPARTKREQTVTFDNPGGMIFEDSPEAEITAFATGHTDIRYSIIQGKDLGRIEERDGEWFLIPNEGRKGTIVVEAITMGDETFDVASATQTYSFNFASSVEYLYTHKSSTDASDQTLFLQVDKKGKALEKLEVEVYDNARSLNPLKRIVLVDNGPAQVAARSNDAGDGVAIESANLEDYESGVENVYAIPLTVADGKTVVHRVDYKFAGVPEEEGMMCEGSRGLLAVQRHIAGLPEHGRDCVGQCV